MGLHDPLQATTCLLTHEGLEEKLPSGAEKQVVNQKEKPTSFFPSSFGTVGKKSPSCKEELRRFKGNPTTDFSKRVI